MMNLSPVQLQTFNSVHSDSPQHKSSSRKTLVKLPKFTPTLHIKYVNGLDLLTTQGEDQPVLMPSKTFKSPNYFRTTFIDGDGVTSGSNASLTDLSTNISNGANTRMVRKVEVDVPNDPLIASQSLRKILEGLSNLFFLESLTMRFYEMQGAYESSFKLFSNVFEKCFKLKDLSLSFTYCDKLFCQANGAAIANSLCNLQTLESFSLEIKETDTLENEFISSILCAVADLENVTKFVLKLHACTTLEDTAFAEFSKRNDKLKKLVVLDLALSYCPQLTNKGIQNLALSLSGFGSLTQLKLAFCGLSSLNDTSIVKFSQEFKKSRKVTVIGFEITDCPNVNVQGFYALRDLLTNFDELKKVSIRVSNMYFVLHSMAAICGALSVYNLIQELNFDLSYSPHIGGKAFLILKDALAVMKSLKSLKLNFDGWTDTINDKSMLMVKDSIGFIKTLKNLELNLMNCSRVSDKGFEIFERLFDNFRGLKGIRLGLRGCRDLTEIGWEYICRGLLRLYDLTRFSLDVTECDKLVESFYTGVEKVLRVNPTVEHIEVHACGTYEVTDRGIGHLKDAVLCSSQVKSVNVSYTDGKTTIYRVDKLRGILEKRLKQTGASVTVSASPYIV